MIILKKYQSLEISRFHVIIHYSGSVETLGKRRGSRRNIPWTCLPLWGKEGIIFQITGKRKRIVGKMGFQLGHHSHKCNDDFSKYWIISLSGSVLSAIKMIASVLSLNPQTRSKPTIPVLG
jgi:hypothetical protein